MTGRLLLSPATWPFLHLNPEPMQNAGDPESIERWYSEMFGSDSMHQQMPSLSPAQAKQRTTARPSPLGQGARHTAGLLSKSRRR